MALTRRTFGNLALDEGGTRWVATDVEPHVALTLKKIFPRIPLHQTGRFTFPVDDFHAVQLLWFMERYPLAHDAGCSRLLRARRSSYHKGQAELERILAPDWRPGPQEGIREGQTVRPYQAQAVELALRSGALLLGDDVGLGKTYTAAALLTRPGTLPAAVVVEGHLQRQWKEKVETFTHLKVHVVTTATAYSLPPADVYLFRYSNVLGWVDLFGGGLFKTSVFDEVQNLRRGTLTERGKACMVLARNASYRLLMSATPVFNYGAEIHTVLEFHTPGENPLGSKDDFEREWSVDDKGKVKDPDALGSHLRERHVLLRRTKGDVGQQMDRVNRVAEEIPYDHAAEKRHEDLAKQLAMKTLSSPVFMERGRAARDLDLLLRQTTGVAKAKYAAAFTRMLLEAGRTVLLVGWHRDVYDIWNRELAEFAPVMFTGSESPSKKDKSRRAFMAGETRLMIMSLRSGSGLDGIQECCQTVVFGELDWSGMVHHQVEGRLDREGQDESVVDAFYLHAEGGSDPAMIEILGIKASQARGITDPNAGVTTVRSDTARIKLLARDYLRRHGVVPPKEDADDGWEYVSSAAPTDGSASDRLALAV